MAAGAKSKPTKATKSSAKEKSKGRDKTRREIKEKARLAKLKLESHRKLLEEKETKLKRLEDSYDNGANPQYKEEYESVKKEFEESNVTLMEYEIDFKKVLGEEMDIDKEEVDEDGELFVGKPGPSGLPLIEVTDPAGSAEDINGDPEVEAMFTLEQARKEAGQSNAGTIVAWKDQRKLKPVIFRYGPKNAAKYELSTADEGEIDITTPQFGPEHRLGDEMVKRKLIRRKREFIAIQGLAYSCDLDDLKPKEKGEKRRLPPLEIRVRWEINGVVSIAWETRSSIRHLWGSPKACDEYIFRAAKYHAARHQEWLDGQRQGKDMSPTPAPGLGGLKEPEIKGKPKEDSSSTPQDAMLKYREQWCALEGIDPKKMNATQKAEFLLSWNKIEVEL